jgi:hypothetical protein
MSIKLIYRPSVMVALMFICTITLQAQVKIGSAGNPNANAVLELDGGTNKGLLLPRLTITQINALNSAPDGLVVFNTTDGFLYLRKAAAWQKISDATGGSGGGLILPYSATASTVGGAEFSITHTTTFGDAVFFSNTASGNAITTGQGNNKLNMTGGNTGIGIPAGITDNPTLGKLVVRGTVGSVSAMFGDNTSGVSVMNNFPSIGFNYYFNNGNKAISTGFGSAIGQDPTTGRMYFSSSASSVTGAGTAMPLVERVTVLANGNVGLGVIAPSRPLSFPNVLGKKVSLYPGTTGDVGFSVEPNELRMYSDNSNAVITMGYDNFTTGFKESLRINPWGSLVSTNPVSLATGLESALYFKTSNYFTGALKAIGTSATTARIALLGYASNNASQLREYLSITDAGNVGIGNANPTSALSFASTLGKKIVLYPGSTGDAGFGVYANELRIQSDYEEADITFGYNQFPNFFTERMRIKGNGNVGIGNNNPGFILDVNNRMRLRHGGGVFTAGLWLDGTTAPTRSFIGTNDNNTVGIYGAAAGWGLLMDVNDGAVMIGTTQKATGYKVNVGGKIIAEEVRVQLRGAWPDYVFEPAYPLQSINQLELYVKENHHLPGIEAASQYEKSGLDLGEINTRLTQKIEELTLYIIQLNKRLEKFENKK